MNYETIGREFEPLRGAPFKSKNRLKLRVKQPETFRPSIGHCHKSVIADGDGTRCSSTDRCGNSAQVEPQTLSLVCADDLARNHLKSAKSWSTEYRQA
jgi:hypothetical protein